MLARSWRSTRPVKTKITAAKDGQGSNKVQALKLECNCRGLASGSSNDSGYSEMNTVLQDSRQAIRSDDPTQKDIKGKGRATTLEQGKNSPVSQIPDRQRFMRDAYAPSTSSSHDAGRTPSSSLELSEVPEDELVVLFELAIERKTAHPVRDSWRSFKALSLDRRKILSVTSLQQLVEVQFSRKFRKGGKTSMLNHGSRMQVILEAIDGRQVENDTLALLLEKAHIWYEELEALDDIPAEDLEGIARILASCLDSWTIEQDFQEEERSYLLRSVELLYLLMKRLKVQNPEEALQLGESTRGRRTYSTSVLRHLIGDNMGVLSERLATEEAGSGETLLFTAAQKLAHAIHEEHSPSQHTRRRTLSFTSAELAARLYQDLMARGIQPDEQFYTILSLALKPVESQSIPFPLLRSIASARPDTSPSISVNTALAKASSEQILRLAVEGRDFELASALYRLLRSRNSFAWSEDDMGVFAALFQAVAKDALDRTTLQKGEKKPKERRKAVAFAAQLYLDWKIDSGKHITPESILPTLLGEIIPLIDDVDLFRSTLNQILADQNISLPEGLLYNLLDQCGAQMVVPHPARQDPGTTRSLSSIWKISHAFADIYAFERHIPTLTLKSYKVVLRAIAQNPRQIRFKTSYGIFRKMEYNGIQPDVEACNLMMEICVGRYVTRKLAPQWYESLLAKGLEPNEMSYGVLLRAYIGMGKVNEAIQVVEGMMNKGLEVTSRIVANLTQKAVQMDKITEARTFLARWIESMEGKQLDSTAVNEQFTSLAVKLRAQGIAPESLLTPKHLQLLQGKTIDPSPSPLIQSMVDTPAAVTKSVRSVAEKPRLVVPIIQEAPDTQTAEESKVLAVNAQQEKGKEEEENEYTRDEQSSWQKVPDQSFLTAFFTSNVETAGPEPSVGSRLNGNAPDDTPQQSLEHNQNDEDVRQGQPLHHKPMYSNPPLPPSFASSPPSFALPSFSQAFSTSSRSSSSSSLGPPSEPTSIDSSSSFLSNTLSSALSSLPYYLADLSFPQLSAIYARYKLEMEAIDRETREQESNRSIHMGSRADADRWRGWKEAGAVPWY